jgi:pyruvate/2-oxoacid:ferredoxin oxidoreductase beta subunit
MERMIAAPPNLWWVANDDEEDAHEIVAMIYEFVPTPGDPLGVDRSVIVMGLDGAIYDIGKQEGDGRLEFRHKGENG